MSIYVSDYFLLSHIFCFSICWIIPIFFSYFELISIIRLYDQISIMHRYDIVRGAISHYIIVTLI